MLLHFFSAELAPPLPFKSDDRAWPKPRSRAEGGGGRKKFYYLPRCRYSHATRLMQQRWCTITRHCTHVGRDHISEGKFIQFYLTLMNHGLLIEFNIVIWFLSNPTTSPNFYEYEASNGTFFSSLSNWKLSLSRWMDALGWNAAIYGGSIRELAEYGRNDRQSRSTMRSLPNIMLRTWSRGTQHIADTFPSNSQVWKKIVKFFFTMRPHWENTYELNEEGSSMQDSIKG